MQHAPDGSLVVTGVVGLAARVQRNVVVVRVLPGHQEVEDRLRAMYGPLVSVVPGALAQAFENRIAGTWAPLQGQRVHLTPRGAASGQGAAPVP
jgi:hypothetical protein